MSVVCSLLQSKYSTCAANLSSRDKFFVIQRFGEKLHTLRTQRGMTLRELTRALGYAGSGYVSEVETGKRVPTAEFVLKVARLFNVSADRLLKDELDLDSDDLIA